ncbi:MAG: oligosaccharide flippase family protein [Candidatus Woesearchaeota archaeon]|nr:oligosaccharide flippase family protein [Candidatus Woesearchaeota archaeon]
MRQHLASISYFYLWKVTELIGIVLFAYLLTPMDFAKIFLPMAVVYFFMNFLDFKIEDNIQKYCNALGLIAPLMGLFTGFIFYLLSWVFPNMGEPFRIGTGIVMFLSFKKTAELYYKTKGEDAKVHRIYFISQLVMLLTSIVLYLVGYGFLSMLIGYLIFHMLGAFMIWWKFPLKLEAKIEPDVMKELFLTWNQRLPDNMLHGISRYGLLFLVALFFGFTEFSYLYLAFILGYFVYKNISLFMTEYMKSAKLIDSLEYISFVIVPISISLIVYQSKMAEFIGWPGLKILPYVALAGLLKAVFELSRMVLKKETIKKIKLAEMFLLVIFSLLGYFGFIWIGVALLASTVMSCLAYFYAVEKIHKLRIFIKSRGYVFVILSGICAGVIITILMELNFPMVVASLAGLAAYISLTMISSRHIYKNIIRMVTKE